MYLIKVKRRFLPFFKKYYVLNYAIESEMLIGPPEDRRLLKVSPWLSFLLPNGERHIIPNIDKKEFSIKKLSEMQTPVATDPDTVGDRLRDV